MSSSSKTEAYSIRVPINEHEQQGTFIINPKVHARVEEWLSQIDAPLKVEDPRIPVEITLQIIEQLLVDDDICTATCLALTGRVYWQNFKKAHPGVIPLDTKLPVSIFSFGTLDHHRCTMANILRSWFGPRYRYSARLNQYLLRAVYGDYPGNKQETALIKRTEDYNEVLSHQGMFPDEQILPNPFGMGEDWYLAAIRTFIDFIQHVSPDVIAFDDSFDTVVASKVYQPHHRSSIGINIMLKNQCAVRTCMPKSNLWGYFGMYVAAWVPNLSSRDGTAGKRFRRRCFWEGIIQASKQDWERHFLLVRDGAKVARLDGRPGS